MRRLRESNPTAQTDPLGVNPITLATARGSLQNLNLQLDQIGGCDKIHVEPKAKRPKPSQLKLAIINDDAGLQPAFFVCGH
jgi:hypothetical protein